MAEGAITIVPYDALWPALFAAEAERIRAAFGDETARIEHVGSTAIPGLAAKPVIDIQISVRSLAPRAEHIARLKSIGYLHVFLGPFDLVYPFFQRPAEWPSTHHVHLCLANSQEERRHLAFRDYLRSHRPVADEYAVLKRRLAMENHGNTLESRERYSLGKSEFVAAVLSNAMRAANDA